MDVSENSGTPKSSILIGFSIINHPFWGTPIFGNTHMFLDSLRLSFCFGAEHDTIYDTFCSRKSPGSSLGFKTQVRDFVGKPVMIQFWNLKMGCY